MKLLALTAALLLSNSVFAQSVCTITGPAGYSGPVSGSLAASCGSAPTPPPVVTPQPNPVPVSGACTASQKSYPLGTVTLQRQCTASSVINPGQIPLTTDATDLGRLLGNKPYPNFGYSGYTLSVGIVQGFYVALQFTPAGSGAFQLVQNPSYGDGGIISLSTVPGSLTPGSPGLVCSFARGQSNSMYVSIGATVCPVKSGVTYYVNMADVDSSGTSRGSGTVAYTIYTTGG